MPRFGGARRAGELRTLGEFVADYREESSFSERADRRLNDRTFGDFRTWLSEQPFERLERELLPLNRIGPREVSNLVFARSLARSESAASSGAATADPNEDRVGERSRTSRRSEATVGVPRRENRVARNLKIAGQAAAADSRRFQPEYSDRTIYGTSYQVGFHSPLVSVRNLRHMKRREVLFARGVLRRRSHSVR